MRTWRLRTSRRSWRRALDRGGGGPERLVRVGSSLLLASDLAPVCVAPPAWGFREEKEGEEEEEEEEEEAGRLGPPLALCVPALVVDSGSGTFLVFLVTFLLALCSLRSSSGLRCPASWPVWTRRTRMQLIDFSLRPLVSGSCLFAVLLGSTVDTCYVSLQRLLWEIAENVPLVRHCISEMISWSTTLGSTVALGDDFSELFVFSAMLGSTVALGDDFVEMVVFSAMLGSTLDTWCCQSTWPFHRCSSLEKVMP